MTGTDGIPDDILDEITGATSSMSRNELASLVADTHDDLTENEAYMLLEEIEDEAMENVLPNLPKPLENMLKSELHNVAIDMLSGE